LLSSKEIPAEQLDLVITDWDASEDEVESLRQKGVKVVIVEKDY
jgi:DeoR/GlpR family transcriptional regulator of sugar metabolism